MRYTMNFKSLILGSAFVLSLFGLTACGDDSSSGADEGTSSAEEYIASSASEISPFDTTTIITPSVSANGKGGQALKLTGTLKLDGDFAYDQFDEESWFFQFDSLQFIATTVEDGKTYKTNLVVKDNNKYPVEQVVLGNTIDKIDLDQIDGCGKFRLFVWMYMSLDCSDADDPDLCNAAAAQDSMQFTAVQTVDFEKECKVIESSSSAEEVCTKLEAVEASLSNLYGTDVYTINLDGGPDAQLTMIVEGGYPSFQAAPGVQIFEEDTQETALVPEGDICFEDFHQAYNSEANPMELNQGSWYLVKTPSKTYPLMVRRFMKDDDSRGTLTFVYFK